MNCKRGFGLALGVGLACGAFLECGASAEPFASLFGAGPWAGQTYYGPQGAVYPVSAKYVYPRVHAKRRHTRRRTHLHRDGGPVQQSELAQRLAAMQKLRPGSLDIFLSDPTLKRSDAVMTNAGIFIFKGSTGDHTQKDFTSLSHSTPIAHRAELAAIERVSIPRFELAQLEKPKPDKAFEDIRQATKTFEAVEPKAIRRIAGIETF